MAKKEYNWSIGSDPPSIDEHTIIKHKIYQDYIAEYITTLNKNPMIPTAKFVVVDAFAGGSLYHSEQKIEHQGSPVKIWQAMQAGEDLVNQARDKKFTLKRKLFLLEKKKSNIDYLKQHLSNLEYDKWFNTDIIIQQGSFTEKYNHIIESIKETLGGKTRTIFILDQYGYKDVPFSSIRDIFKQLPLSEVILTLSVDDIIDYAPNSTASDLFDYKKPMPKNTLSLQETFNSIGLDSNFISNIKTSRAVGWRSAIEYHVTEKLVFYTQAKQYSPFFLSRKNSHKAMLLVHLANHPEATNVMKTIYHKYGNQNKTIVSHYGGAGLDMLGYNHHLDFKDHYKSKEFGEYDFGQKAKEETHNKLLDDIPREIRDLESISFKDFYRKHASQTPATKEMIRNSIEESLQLYKIKVSNRKPRSSIRDSDILYPNPQISFSFHK